MAQGCAPTTLTNALWPGWRCWTIDADRGISPDRLKTLCRASGVGADAIADSSRGGIAERAAGTNPKIRSTWRWIVSRGRPSSPTSSPYCPACLREDGTPYYRNAWRLAWHTGCADHGTTLAERCPHCENAQQLGQLRADARDVATCSSCGGDLRDAVTRNFPSDARKFQEVGDEVASSDHGTVFGRQTDAAGWFAAADFLGALIRRAVRSPTTGLTRLLLAAGIDSAVGVRAAPGQRIEGLGVHDRQRVAAAVWRIMKLDGHALRGAARAADISRQSWLGDRRTAPDVLLGAMPTLPDRPANPRRRARKRRAGPRPRHEVQKMMQRLERMLHNTAEQ